MTHFANVFLMGYALVFSASFQSLCVNSGYRGIATVNSILIAVFQALLFRQIVGSNSGWGEIAAYGMAGAAAVNTAMSLHKRVKR